jgi:hypothetical protein
MITTDGWLGWAERMPGRPASGPGFNAGVNGARGLIFHSAEGFAATMLSPTSRWGYYSAEYPWHLSNLLDGRLVQHYPFHVRCWHGSAFNQEYVGMEHEGRTPDGSPVGPVLNEGQIANAVRVASDLGEWKGWTPRRPVSDMDLTATLYEHNETVRFGGTATQCPSHRIPWDEILRRIAMPEPADRQWLYGNEQAGEEVVGNQIFIWHLGIVINKIGDEAGLMPGRREHNEGGVFVVKEP